MVNRMLPHTDQRFPACVREAIRLRGRALIRSSGGSMAPAIRDGALLEVRPVAFDELQRGDIVVYHFAGECFCHRLIRKMGTKCIVKGDTLLAADPPVAWNQVIGRVSALYEGGRLDARIVPLDDPTHRRRALWHARATYPYALLFRARRLLTRWGRNRGDAECESQGCAEGQ